MENLALRENGPILDMIIASRDEENRVERRYPLLFDTGSGASAVDESLLLDMGLVARNYGELGFGREKKKTYPLYAAQLSIADVPSRFFRVFIFGIPGYSSDLYRGIVGRDFLQHVKFSYDGVNGDVSVTYPRRR